MKTNHRQEIIRQPAALQAMQRGVDVIASAIRPTLGPQPRRVALARELDKEHPELLDDGGLIARRIIQLPDRDADMGAMLLRQMLWKLREEVGDGTATAAVLFQSIFDQGVRYVTAGAEPMLLRDHLEALIPVLMETLDSVSVCVESEAMLAQVAESVCYDPPLAKMLGEIFDILGEYGQLEIRPGRSRILEREYVEGMYWNTGIASRTMLGDGQKVELENAAILMTDLALSDPNELLPVMEQVVRGGIPALMIVAASVSEQVLAFLRAANQQPERFRVIAVKTPGQDTLAQFIALEDLAILVGGQPVIRATGQALANVRLADLGRARRAWASAEFFGIVGGKGDPRRLRQHLAQLRAAFAQATKVSARRDLQQRIGKLMGGTATLWVGDNTEPAIQQRVERAKRAAAAQRSAIRDGVVPGGGVALLDCKAALQQRLSSITDENERAAYNIVIRALDVPLRTMLANAGFSLMETGAIFADIEREGRGFGFDLRSHCVHPMMKAGVYDSTGVIKAVVRHTLATAALALTIDTLVHSRNPAVAAQP